MRELSGLDYHFITILDSNQINDRKIKSVSEKKRYDFGDAYLVDCTIELEDSNDKGYIFETRAVQVYWDNGRTSVLITNLSEEIFTTDNVVKSYFNRWPAQELNLDILKTVSIFIVWLVMARSWWTISRFLSRSSYFRDRRMNSNGN